MGPWVSLQCWVVVVTLCLSQTTAGLCPFSTAIGALVPWWSKGQGCLSIFDVVRPHPSSQPFQSSFLPAAWPSGSFPHVPHPRCPAVPCRLHHLAW